MQVIGLIKLRLVIDLGNLGIIGGVSYGDTFLQGVSRAHSVAACIARLQAACFSIPKLAIAILLLVPSIGNYSLLGLPLRLDSGIPVDVCPEGFLDCLDGDLHREGTFG